MKWSRNPFFKAPVAPATEPEQEPASLVASAATTAGAGPVSDGEEYPTPAATDDDQDRDLERGVSSAASSATVRPEAPPSTVAPHNDDHEEEPPLLLLQKPTDAMTRYQFFYIFIIDGIGAMVLSGGINFAIAYAMYTSQDTERHPIRLFQLPNTLAGDAAVTIIVQCIITWLIELVLVNRDLAKGAIAPVGFLQPPEWRPARWFLFLDRKAETARPGSAAHWLGFMASQVLRALLVAVPSFALLWPISVGVLTAFGTRSGGDWVYDKTWVPQVFKLILGGLLSLLTTPPFALFWLARAGWALRTNEVLVTPRQVVQ